MVHPKNTALGRALAGRIVTSTRRKLVLFICTAVFVFSSIVVYGLSEARLKREEAMETALAEMRSALEFIEARYRERQEEVINLKTKFSSLNSSSSHDTALDPSPTLSPALNDLLKNISGTRAAAGIHTKHIKELRTPFVYQLLPHLMQDSNSLKPAFHMKGGRKLNKLVVGIPTVKRDKESYLMLTLNHLISGLTALEIDNTLIVVMIGETDLEYVVKTAWQIEVKFTKYVKRGLIEVLSPSLSYYPDFDTLPATLGDSQKRVKWRTKQNLDTIYLMAYAQSKGIYYLMLEDDVIAKKNYALEITLFAAETSVVNPNWFFIEFCQVGGIGKLFHSADLIHFITYVQLFYNNMPIDWLLESYLADRTCTIVKTAKKCTEAKEAIRPKYKTSLFQHIGLYSSLKGKIQKIKDTQFGAVPTFYPHTTNPPLRSLKTDIPVHPGHPLKAAYDGQSYFWGEKPRKGNVVEFWFEKPIFLAHYTFRSGNVEHIKDKFYDTSVEVLGAKDNNTFTQINTFDEFGLAEGRLAMGYITAIRLKVNKNSSYWVIISEIELKEYQPPDKGR